MRTVRLLSVGRWFLALAATAVAVKFWGTGSLLEDWAILLATVGGAVLLLCSVVLRQLWQRQPGSPRLDFPQRDELEQRASAYLSGGERPLAVSPAYEAVADGPLTQFPKLLVVTGIGFHSLGLLSRPHAGTIGSHLVVRLTDITKVVSTEARIHDGREVLRNLAKAVGPHPRAIAKGEYLNCQKITITLASGHSHVFWSPYKALDDVLSEINDRRANGAILDQTIGGTQALDRLRTLLEEGLIEQSEFDRAKAGFLGAPAERQQTTEARIRQLHSLMTDGILTESEFRQKKWDLLSRSG